MAKKLDRDFHRQEFASCGFLFCPLSVKDFDTLDELGVDPEEVHGIGCDVYAGFSLTEALEYR